jgi:hypothetical protein
MSRSAFWCVQGVKHSHTIFMLVWSQGSFHKKCTGTRYAKLVFLHPVASAGHVVISGVSRPRMINALFFMLGWDWYRFNKMCDWTRYAHLLFLHQVGSVCHVVHIRNRKHQCTIFQAWVGL